jgi:hypothetical protein
MTPANLIVSETVERTRRRRAAPRSDRSPVKTNATVDLPSLATRLNAEHQAACASADQTLAHAIEAGRLLTQAKDAVGHGGWIAWLERNFEGSPRLAQQYMRLARELPKLQASLPANTKRASHLISIREAIQAVNTSAYHLNRAEPQIAAEAIKRVEAENVTLPRAIRSSEREAQNRPFVQAAREAEAGKVWVEAPVRPSWSTQNRERLERDAGLLPHVAELQVGIDRLDTEHDRITAEIERLYAQLQKVDNEHCDLATQRRAAVRDAIEREHGPLVDGARVARVLVDAAEALQLETQTEETRRERIFPLAHRCIWCGVYLDKTHAEPAGDGMVFVVCRWCRSHRGETHCIDCGVPLADGGDEGSCPACVAAFEARYDAIDDEAVVEEGGAA